MILGPECARRRLAAGWTRDALGAAAEVSVHAICNLENGKSRLALSFRQRIENALDRIERGELSPPKFMKFRGR